MKRTFVAGLIGLAFALTAGLTAAVAPASAPITGTRQVHVDGDTVTVDCTGRGSPTVVLFAGFGDPHTIWGQIQRDLSRHNRVCSYDRLGEGTSSAPRATMTLASNARLLHDVLGKLHIRGPIVAVGHSVGGDIAATYARTYRRQTAGAVLFDATPDGYLQWLLKVIPANATGLLQALREEAVTTVSGDNQEKLKLGTGWSPAGSLGHTPLAVVEHGQDIFAGTGSYDHRLQNRWAAGEFKLADLSSRSQVIIATRSGHYIYQDQPQLALDVINAVMSDPDPRVVAA